MNNFFAFVLFVSGLGLVMFSACVSIELVHTFFPDVTLLSGWGVVWRVGLGFLLMLLGLLVKNLEGITG